MNHLRKALQTVLTMGSTVVQLELIPEESRQLIENGFLDYLVFGLLDVLMAEWAHYPLLNIRVRIVGVQIDRIRSSKMAFRRAAREAARQLIELVRNDRS
jgi:Elongation factor G, domain IV